MHFVTGEAAEDYRRRSRRTSREFRE